MAEQNSKMMMVSPHSIVVDERLRALRRDRIDELAASMRDRGLLQPIILRVCEGSDRYILVSGSHRLEAAKSLKWETINAVVYENMATEEAVLAAIDENLVRAELSPAEHAAHVGRRKELYEKRHPETKHGAVGRRGKSSQNEKSFVEDTATKTGKGRSTVARDVTRASKVAVLDQIVGTSLDKGDEIDALAKLPEDEQQDLARRAQAGEIVSAKARAARQREMQVRIIRPPSSGEEVNLDVKATKPAPPVIPRPPLSALAQIKQLLPKLTNHDWHELERLVAEHMRTLVKGVKAGAESDH